MSQTQFTKEEAKLAINFLERSTLRGAEVPAFNAVISKLGKIISAPKEDDGGLNKNSNEDTQPKD